MTTNGQLLRLSPRHRANTIARLHPDVRMKLAHLALYGIQKARADMAEWEELALQLTTDHDDGKEDPNIGKA